MKLLQYSSGSSAAAAALLLYPREAAVAPLPSSPFVLRHGLAVWFDSLLLGVALVLGVRYLLEYSSHHRTSRTAVSVSLVLLIVQSIGVKVSDVGIQQRAADLAQAASYAGRNWGGLVANLVASILMGVPHLVLASQAVRFARSSSARSGLLVRLFAACLYASIALCFVSGMVCAIFIYLQAMDLSLPDVVTPTLVVNLISSAVIDVVLACTLTWELRQSRSRTSSLSSSAIITSLSHVLLSNGVLLAVYQITTSALYLATRSFSMALIPLTCLGKVYAITMILAIVRPLDARKAWAENGGEARAAKHMSDEEKRLDGAAAPYTTQASFVTGDPQLNETMQASTGWKKLFRRDPHAASTPALEAPPMSFGSFFTPQASSAGPPKTPPGPAHETLADDVAHLDYKEDARHHGLDIEFVLGGLKNGDDVVRS